MDLSLPDAHKGKPRRDWGLQNLVGFKHPGNIPVHLKNAHQQRKVRQKVANFVRTAIYPQQLTIPRQYATTKEGVSLYKILEGRIINGIQEQGVRVIVQENLQQARFVISPLHASQEDAIQWARQNMGMT